MGDVVMRAVAKGGSGWIPQLKALVRACIADDATKVLNPSFSANGNSNERKRKRGANVEVVELSDSE
jgi:hypothetical protein